MPPSQQRTSTVSDKKWARTSHHVVWSKVQTDLLYQRWQATRFAMTTQTCPRMTVWADIDKSVQVIYRSNCPHWQEELMKSVVSVRDNHQQQRSDSVCMKMIFNIRFLNKVIMKQIIVTAEMVSGERFFYEFKRKFNISRRSTNTLKLEWHNIFTCFLYSIHLKTQQR